MTSVPPSGHASDQHVSAAGTARYVLLIVGAGIMILPFLYMLSTSFKSQTYVLTIPPQFIPHPATVQNYPDAWHSGDFGRYLDQLSSSWPSPSRRRPCWSAR